MKILGLGLLAAVSIGLVVAPSTGRRPLESRRVDGGTVALLEAGRGLEVAEYAGTLKPQQGNVHGAPSGWRGAVRTNQARLRPANARPSLVNPGLVARPSASPGAGVRAFSVPALAGAR